MENALKQMLKSKKAIAMMAGIIVAGLGHIGLNLSPEEVTGILAPVLAYIVGQGVADHGKEKARMVSQGDANAISAAMEDLQAKVSSPNT